MNGQPKVSVIIPVYNVELYLKECLESVTSQTYHKSYSGQNIKIFAFI